MISPFYRSRLFWLGVPGLVFLLWCWWDSQRHYTEVTRARPTSLTFAYQHKGVVGLVVTEEAPYPAFDGPKFEWMRLDVDEAPLWSAALVELLGSNDYYEAARSEVFPGLFRRQWVLAYAPPAGSMGDPRMLPYQEWGAYYWLVVSCYSGLWLSAAVAVWQRRKARISRRAPAGGA